MEVNDRPMRVNQMHSIAEESFVEKSFGAAK